MTERGASRLSARLWPQVYGVVHLTGEGARAAVAPEAESDGAPSFTLRRGDEVTLGSPLEQLSGAGFDTSSSGHWRALALDGVPADRMPLVLRDVTAVLHEVGTPVLTVTTGFELVLLLPEALLGRALAALAQARLERLL